MLSDMRHLNYRLVPDVQLAEIKNGEIVKHRSRNVLGRGRILLAGAPGAFTPVCTQQHIPNLVHHADALHRQGFSEIICLVSSDPFSIEEWRTRLDPAHKIHFLSDGNLDFVTALSLVEDMSSLHMGRRSSRFRMVLVDGIIQSVGVEASVFDFSCSRVDDMLEV